MLKLIEYIGYYIILITWIHINPSTNDLIRNNLIMNGNFTQIEANGYPSMWAVQNGHGDIVVQVLPRKYLSFNVLEISVYTNKTYVMLSQTISLQQSRNRNILMISFWFKTSITFSSASIRLEFYNSTKHKIQNEYMKSFAGNTSWSLVQLRTHTSYSVPSVKLLIRMHYVVGSIYIANMSMEQVDSWENTTFFVAPKQDGTMFIEWTLERDRTEIATYDILRGTGILSALNHSHLLVTIPTKFAYGKNIYESMYTDHTVQLDTIYTYQVIGRYSNKSIADQTMLRIGQADLLEDYYGMTVLIAFPRVDGIHLSWRLRASSTARYVILYQGIDSVVKINNSEARLLGNYSVQTMKTVVSIFNTGPFLLISDDGNDVATTNLASLTRPRIVLTQSYLDFLREKIKQPGHAQEIFKHLIKFTYKYQPENSFNYCWVARDAALLYALTRDIAYVHTAYLALDENRMNYTIYDNSAIKLRFGLSTMARAQAFDWAYDAFTSEHRRELISDFQYAASIFASYSDDHSLNPDDKASNWVAIVKSGELIQHLTLYGEEGYPNDQAERRILFLLNELRLHLDHAYGPSGFMQEGLNYLAYTLPILGPAVYLVKSMGISVLDESWSRPDWHNLALHVLSFRKHKNVLQFGVSDSTYSSSGFLPFIFNSTDNVRVKAAIKWFYDRAMGINASVPGYDDKDRSAALFYYPYDIPAEHPTIAMPRSASILNDHVDGFYAFRNRYQDQNDVLVGLVNRNRRHAGWNANETFALTIISHDTIWAQMPGKEYFKSKLTRKYSTPLIDGQPREPPKAKRLGYEREIQAFNGQGGGYVSLDSSINLNITLARRDICVDMIPRNNIDTIIALHDQYMDSLPHAWHWQLSPDPTETKIRIDNENNLLTFIISGRNESWMKIWLYDDQHVTLNTTENVLRIIQNGNSANFKIVMALGMGTDPIASRTKTGIRLSDACIDFNALSNGVQCPTTTTILGMPRAIFIVLIVMISLSVVLLIIGIKLKQHKKKSVSPTVETEPVIDSDRL